MSSIISETRRLSRPRFALAVLFGVYPIITAILYIVLPLTEGWPLWSKSLVISPVMVIIMVFGLIPTIQTRCTRFTHVCPR